MVLCTSLSPPDPLSSRVDPMESISSMKMIEGACSLQDKDNVFTSKVQGAFLCSSVFQTASNKSCWLIWSCTWQSSHTSGTPGEVTFCHHLALPFALHLLVFAYLAMTKSSRTIREPSPMNFCTSSDPDTLMKVHSVWCATARASSVFPVPGGPYSSTP